MSDELATAYVFICFLIGLAIMFLLLGHGYNGWLAAGWGIIGFITSVLSLRLFYNV